MPFLRFSHNIDETINEGIRDPEQYENWLKTEAKKKEDMTGWERVVDLFEKDEWGSMKPELERCRQTVILTTLAGVVIGAVGRSRISYMNFFRSNAHTAFETPLKAKAKLQETVLMGMGSGGFRVGWRVAVFSTLYSVTAVSLAAYRGKSSLLDPVTGGALAGFVYKFKEGPKYMLAGTTIGGLFGLIGGGITMLAISLAGLSQDEILAKSYDEIKAQRYKEYEKMVETRETTLTGAGIPMTELHTSLLELNDRETSQPVEPSSSHLQGKSPSENSVSSATPTSPKSSS